VLVLGVLGVIGSAIIILLSKLYSYGNSLVHVVGFGFYSRTMVHTKITTTHIMLDIITP
jgi:hypothetical protein